MPRQTMGSTRATYIDLPQHNHTNAGLCIITAQQSNPHNKQRHHTRTTGRSQNIRRSSTPHHHQQDRNPLNPIWCRHGHVPRRGYGLCNTNDRPVVKRLLYEIHPQTNRGIYLRHFTTNAHHAILPPRPKQRTIIVASANRKWRVGFADAASRKRGKWRDIVFSATRDRARGDHLLIIWSKSQHSISSPTSH